MTDKAEHGAFVRLLEAVRADAPELKGEFERFDSGVVLMQLFFPVQPTLAFEVVLQFHDGALCLGAGSMFWAEYFPPEDQRVQADFRRAAEGLLRGTMRIVEHVRGDRVVGAALEEARSGGWTIVARTGRLHFPIGTSHSRVLRRSEIGEKVPPSR